MVYICIKFGENILNGLKSFGVDMISILIITKGYNSVNIARGVTVLVLCSSSDHGIRIIYIYISTLGYFISHRTEQMHSTLYYTG